MASTSTPADQSDERVLATSALRRVLTRPELGAAAGALLVWVILALAAPSGFLSLRGTASYLEVSAQLGILAVAVSLLMIGGEFDLSVGSIVGFSGAAMAIMSTETGIPLYVSALIALAISLLIGFLNGFMVIRTKLPSFIITLGSLFIIRGLTIGLTRLFTGRTQIGGLGNLPGYGIMQTLFDSNIVIAGVGFPISIVWWLLLAAIATWILLRTRVGNWIFGAGGSAEAARNVGVPVDRLKVGLFMATAFSAWLLATITVTATRSADTLRGQLQEFYAIIAVVIGGTLLTGGYGSAVGAVLGALIFGMVRQGMVFARVDADWFQVFMGAMLIIAVLVNNYIRKRAEAAKE